MKLLVIGSGGREHALAWRLAQSPRVHKVYVAPGTGGTATEEGLENLPVTDFPGLIDFAQKEGITFKTGIHIGHDTLFYHLLCSKSGDSRFINSFFSGLENKFHRAFQLIFHPC